jgi:hypothetical protein
LLPLAIVAAQGIKLSMNLAQAKNSRGKWLRIFHEGQRLNRILAKQWRLSVMGEDIAGRRILEGIQAFNDETKRYLRAASINLISHPQSTEVVNQVLTSVPFYNFRCNKKLARNKFKEKNYSEAMNWGRDFFKVERSKFEILGASFALEFFERENLRMLARCSQREFTQWFKRSGDYQKNCLAMKMGLGRFDKHQVWYNDHCRSGIERELYMAGFLWVLHYWGQLWSQLMEQSQNVSYQSISSGPATN